METDREKLLRLAGRAHLGDFELVCFRDHIDKCQNICCQDGTVSEETWYKCRDYRKALEAARDARVALGLPTRLGCDAT